MSLGCHARRAFRASLLLLLVALVPASARAYGSRSFAAGSYIIPMDIDYQDSGMLSAFGLVDALLRQGVPVWWCINPGKVYGTVGDVDFTVDLAHDLRTNSGLASHGYRGGPFVIDSGDVGRAFSIVHSWQVSHEVSVHVADVAFTAPYWQVMTASPRIAVLASTKQSTAFTYLNAAGIPDENGLAWSSSSVDVIPATSIDSGALLQGYRGAALYNALLMPGWDNPGGADATTAPAIAAYLNAPALLFAEDATAINIESQDLLTSSGTTSDFTAMPSTVQYGSSEYSPFFQMDARPTNAFQPDPSGAYSMLNSGNFYDNSIEMLQGSGASRGRQDIWLAGFANGTCTEAQLGSCTSPVGPRGRVAYLGGYYSTTLPISTHPSTQGTRLFLDALFAGTCTIAEAQPLIAMSATGPGMVTAPTVSVTITAQNVAAVMASNFFLSYPLPAGATFVSATNGGSYSGGVVTWGAPTLGYGVSTGGNVTMTLPDIGSYSSAATANYKVGNTPYVTTQGSPLQIQFTCPTPGLVAWWPAEGNADDVAGSHNGTLQNGATFAPGKVGSAFSLNGTNANVSIPDAPALRFTNAMSVAGWIKTTAGTDRYIATKHEDSFYFAVGGGSVAPHMLSLWLNGVSSSWFTGVTPVDDGQWHHVAATYDGATMRLYVDGHLDNSAASTGSITSSGTFGMLIGARSDGTNASNFAGLIDELSVYNRAIGPAEVAALAGMSEPCAAASVGDAPTAARVLQLAPPWPNPATKTMSFEFRTPGVAETRAEIVDVAGRRVSEPLKGQLLPGGAHRFQWDGRDASGARLAAGVYLIRITSGAATAVQRIVLVR